MQHIINIYKSFPTCNVPTSPCKQSLPQESKRQLIVFNHSTRFRRILVRSWHTLHLLTQRPPVIRLQFCILDALLAPLLVQSRDVVLALLEEEQFVTDAFLDEDAASVLLDNRFLILLLLVRGGVGRED